MPPYAADFVPDNNYLAQLPEWARNIEEKITSSQKMIREFIITHPACGAFLTMGSGKTLATLSALTYIQPAGHILVIAPATIARTSWLDDIDHWNIPITHRSLFMTKGKRSGKSHNMSKKERHESYSRVLSEPPSLYIISVDLIEDLIEYFATKGHKNKTSNYSLWPFSTIIIDESQTFKTATSKRSRAMRKVVPYTTRRILLTGTPASEEPGDIFGQMLLIDQGQSLGTSQHYFREQFFHAIKNQEGFVIKYQPKLGAKEEIFNRIKPWTMTVTTPLLNVPDCHIVDKHVDLDDYWEEYDKFKENAVLNLYYASQPTADTDDAGDTNASAIDQQQVTTPIIRNILDTVDHDRADIQHRLDDLTYASQHFQHICQTYAPVMVETTPAESQAILNIRDTDIDPSDIDTIIAQNKAVLNNKLLQFASGALYFDPMATQLVQESYTEIYDPQTDTVDVIENIINSAINADTSKYEHTSDGKAYIPLHTLKLEALYDIIKDEDLTTSPVLVVNRFSTERDRIIEYLKPYGIDAQAFDGSKEMLDEWNNKKIPVMIIHPQSAAHGLNFQFGGHILVWFTLPHSAAQYDQANARLHRPGQTEDVYIYRIIVDKTVDEDLPDILEAKRSGQKQLLDAIDRKQISDLRRIS